MNEEFQAALDKANLALATAASALQEAIEVARKTNERIDRMPLIQARDHCRNHRDDLPRLYRD